MDNLSIFQTIGPHRLVENFMGEMMVHRLIDYALQNQDHFVIAKIDGRPTPDLEGRVASVLRDLGPFAQELAMRFRQVFPWALQELGIPVFDVAHMELELAAHGDGAFYKTHIDTKTHTLDTDTDRVLTGVYYFHQHPKAFSGGELRLHSIAGSEHGGQFKDIVPPSDSLLLFPSWIPHEVRPVSCPSKAFADSRFAVNCWYRKQRGR